MNDKECPTRIPQGLAFVACDGEEKPWSGGLYDGIGGVKFCDVPIGALVHLEFAAFNGPLGGVGVVICYTYEAHVLGRITPEGAVEAEVPYSCDTELWVYIYTADANEMELYAPVDGEIVLRVLSTGGSA